MHLKATGDSANRIAGLALPVGVEFATGVIELDLKGKNVPAESFLGVVFNVVDEKRFEGVYFRPFNFKAADELRRGHSVQYIAWPENTWEKLRKAKPGQFEKPVDPVPDPAQTDSWGVKVANVEIKQVDLTESMIRAIARQAEAERERRAKVIHAEGELQASEKLYQAAKILAQEPQAIQLRYLETLTVIGADKNSTIVFPLPMDLLAPFLERLKRLP